MSVTLALTIPPAYGWVLFSSMIVVVAYYYTVTRAMRARIQVFSNKFIREHFGNDEVLKNAELGYPDMGHGRIADKLSAADWVLFNNAQRAHYNFLEGIVPAQISLLVAGLTFPRIAAPLGVVYAVGRLLYATAYATKGSTGRRLGAVVFYAAFAPLVLLGFASAWTIGGGAAGFAELFAF